MSLFGYGRWKFFGTEMPCTDVDCDGQNEYDNMGEIAVSGIGTFSNDYCKRVLGWATASNDFTVPGSKAWCEVHQDDPVSAHSSLTNHSC